jgi:hypothetical protein
LENLFARLEAPFLNRIIIKFLNPPAFDISRIFLILGVPEPGFRQAELFFDDDFVEVALSQGPPVVTHSCYHSYAETRNGASGT